MKTTEKHYKLFKRECLRLIKEWGLSEWDVWFQHKKLEESDSQLGRAYKTLTASITLAKEVDIGEFDNGLTPDEYIKECAKHEVLHLLIGRLADLGKDRYFDRLYEEEEQVIYRLSKIVK